MRKLSFVSLCILTLVAFVIWVPNTMAQDCVTDSDCDDGMFCTGAETCDTGICLPGTPPDCDDGVGCTDDVCDEINDACVNTPDDTNCPNDGLFCNGDEICDPAAGCSYTGDPCPLGTVCNEELDTCPVATNVGSLIEVDVSVSASNFIAEFGSTATGPESTIECWYSVSYDDSLVAESGQTFLNDLTPSSLMFETVNASSGSVDNLIGTELFDITNSRVDIVFQDGVLSTIGLGGMLNTNMGALSGTNDFQTVDWYPSNVLVDSFKYVTSDTDDIFSAQDVVYTVTETVQTPAEAIDDLIPSIEDLALPIGMEISLVAKLEAAIKSLENGQDDEAISQLSSFINQVEAQRGKRITVEQADAFIAVVQMILDNI